MEDQKTKDLIALAMSGCVFTFGVEDTEVIQVDYNETKRTIKCPDCGKRIYVE